MSLADLKALAAADEDFENSRIKLGLQSLVSKGTLVQTKGIGASGFQTQLGGHRGKQAQS